MFILNKNAFLSGGSLLYKRWIDEKKGRVFHQNGKL
jgi:hypothetical protein